jgi:hypothetical protein
MTWPPLPAMMETPREPGPPRRQMKQPSLATSTEAEGQRNRRGRPSGGISIPRWLMAV